MGYRPPWGPCGAHTVNLVNSKDLSILFHHHQPCIALMCLTQGPIRAILFIVIGHVWPKYVTACFHFFIIVITFPHVLV